MLATAGDLISSEIWIAGCAYAGRATTGKVLWEQTIGGPIASNSTITYSGERSAIPCGRNRRRPADLKSVIGYAPGFKEPKGANAIYVFALPQKK